MARAALGRADARVLRTARRCRFAARCFFAIFLVGKNNVD